MLVKTVTTKEVETEIEIETPSFWKYDNGRSFAAIYSPEKVVRVEALTDSFSSIVVCEYQVLHRASKILEGERISDEEFNAALSESVAKIKALSEELIPA